MSFRSVVLAIAFTATVGTLVATHVAHAATSNRGWSISPVFGSQTTPVVTDVFSQSAIVGWTDRRSGAGDVWFCTFDTSGFRSPYIPPAPMPAPGAVYGLPMAGEQALTPRGRGKYIAYLNGSSNFDIGIVSGTSPGWGGGASPFNQEVIMATGDQVAPSVHKTESDAVIVAWQDGRLAGNSDIYVAGKGGVWSPPPNWPANPMPLCTAAGNQTTPVVCSDGSNGAIVAWVDARTGTTDIFAQRVTSAGATVWTIDGRVACAAAGAQNSVEIVSDGAGGAILAWIDYRNGNADIYAQRLSPMGSPMWGPSGLPVCTEASTQDGLVLRSDFAGGCYLAWVDARNGQDIYVDQLDATGLSVLTGGVNSNGAPLTALANGAQSGVVADSDSLGFYLAWEDRGGSDSDIHAAGLYPFLSTRWDVVVCDAQGDQTAPSIAAEHVTRRGGAVIVWQDARGGASRPQIYGQRIRMDGTFAAPDADAPRIAKVRDVPNDQGGRVALSFEASGLDRTDYRMITEYRVWRRVAPSAAVVAAAGHGAAALRGRYLARPAAGALAANASTYWEAVATLAAQQLEGYGYTAGTTQDSIAGVNPYSAFFVTALTSDPNLFFESAVDSGYSVDNLAPAMVQGFVGQGDGATTALHWSPNAEPDFAVYRVHRGTSADFVPGPGNLVAEQPDTGFVDTTPGHHHHKIVAVDVHGNAGPPALVTPQVTNSVGDARLRGAWLSEVRPNPVRRQGTIAYGLAREGDVTLDVYDIRGARVRRLVDGRLQPGEHVAQWDGRNSDGVRVANGVYFYRLVTAAGSFSRRLTLAD